MSFSIQAWIHCPLFWHIWHIMPAIKRGRLIKKCLKKFPVLPWCETHFKIKALKQTQIKKICVNKLKIEPLQDQAGLVLCASVYTAPGPTPCSLPPSCNVQTFPHPQLVDFFYSLLLMLACLCGAGTGPDWLDSGSSLCLSPTWSPCTQNYLRCPTQHCFYITERRGGTCLLWLH